MHAHVSKDNGGGLLRMKGRDDPGAKSAICHSHRLTFLWGSSLKLFKKRGKLYNNRLSLCQVWFIWGKIRKSKMKKVVKLSAIVLSAGLFVGCASTSDIDYLQSQIDDLKNQTSKIAADASAARAAAAEAGSRAAAAEKAADRAASYAEDTNRKLDNMFKKSLTSCGVSKSGSVTISTNGVPARL